jgi:hypothetical protein
LLLGAITLLPSCDRREKLSELPAPDSGAPATTRPPLHELLLGKWSFDSVRGAQVEYDQAKLATLSWEFTPDAMITYMDHRQTHEEHYRVVSEIGNVLTVTREPTVEGKFEFIDDDTITWTHQTLGVVTMKHTFRRPR